MVNNIRVDSVLKIFLIFMMSPNISFLYFIIIDKELIFKKETFKANFQEYWLILFCFVFSTEC